MDDRERERHVRLITSSHEITVEAKLVIADTRRTIERTKELIRIRREIHRRPLAAVSSA